MCPIIMKFTLKSYCGKKNIVFKDNCRISVRSKVIFLFRLTLLGVLICGNKLLFFFFLSRIGKFSQTLSLNPQFTPQKKSINKNKENNPTYKKATKRLLGIQSSCIGVSQSSQHHFTSLTAVRFHPFLPCFTFCSSFFS